MIMQRLHKSGLNFNRLIWLVVTMEWCMMICSGLHLGNFFGSGLFEFDIDPMYWAFFFTGIPRLIQTQLGFGLSLSILTGVCLFIGILKPEKRMNAILVFALLLSHYLMMTAHMGHRNFQAGFFLILIPFFFKGESQILAWEGMRYWILLFYASAGLFKLFHLPDISINYLADQLQQKWLIYHLEYSSDIRMQIIDRLIANPYITHLIYWIGCMLELFCLIGLFTRRLDGWIFWGLVVFHVGIWLCMDIGFIGQLAFLLGIIYPYDKAQCTNLNHRLL